MKDSYNTVLNTTFGAFPIIMGYFKYIGALKSKLDYLLAILATIISTIILFVKHIWALDIAHFLYVFVYLYIVSFSFDKFIFIGFKCINACQYNIISFLLWRMYTK